MNAPVTPIQPPQPHYLENLLDLCEEADKNGNGTIRTTTVRRLVSQALTPPKQ